MKTKAQSLPINVIIVAALALVVLIVLGLVFTGSFRNWRGAAESCLNKKGTCTTAAECKGDDRGIVPGVCYKADKNVDTGKVCCMIATTPDPYGGTDGTPTS